ncbi:MAG: IS21 family transposase [Mogibacterium sp.]|nr:IS21 family transposase [Mogibacterium sp.]
MVNYREIFRLRSLGYSITQIAAAVHSSRSTIRDVYQRADQHDISWPLSDETNNNCLYEQLYPERQNKANVWMEPDCEWIHRELPGKGVNLTLLWKEYKVNAINAGRVPYQYSQFCDIYRSWARKTKATMRIHHKPGDEFEVDWAGGTLPITDPVTGAVSDAYLFVGVLPCSCYAYAELFGNMRSENWLVAHVHAYEYFEGVTRLLIPDNLRTGVTKNTKYETVMNRSYEEMADHYGTAIVPARVEHPKDKPNAEGTVKYATTWILAALRNETFFSLDDARKAVKEKLEELNTAPFQKRKGNRREAYLFEEKEFMQPLPVNPYEPSVWSEQKVLYDYTVTDGINKYSVPFDLIGESVDVRTTRDAVEVFFHGSRVAVHVRVQASKREPIMKPSHMPENHRKYLEYTADDFKSWADSIGPNTFKVVKFFLESGRVPEQGYKPCVSLRKLEERYSPARLEEACRQILTFNGDPSIRGISILLKTPLKGAPKDAASPVKRKGHGITRGAEQFREGGDLK